MPIDGLISFAGSDMGAQVFGADDAKRSWAHAEEIKASGAKYCDCPACAACEALLNKKAEIRSNHMALFEIEIKLPLKNLKETLKFLTDRDFRRQHRSRKKIPILTVSIMM